MKQQRLVLVVLLFVSLADTACPAGVATVSLGTGQQATYPDRGDPQSGAVRRRQDRLPGRVVSGVSA